jgi:hypothetical protein
VGCYVPAEDTWTIRTEEFGSWYFVRCCNYMEKASYLGGLDHEWDEWDGERKVAEVVRLELYLEAVLKEI